MVMRCPSGPRGRVNFWIVGSRLAGAALLLLLPSAAGHVELLRNEEVAARCASTQWPLQTSMSFKAAGAPVMCVGPLQLGGLLLISPLIVLDRLHYYGRLLPIGIRLLEHAEALLSSRIWRQTVEPQQSVQHFNGAEIKVPSAACWRRPCRPWMYSLATATVGIAVRPPAISGPGGRWGGMIAQLDSDGSAWL